MALFLFVIIIAIALGILGIVLKGLFWLLIIGIVLFLVNLVFGGMRLGRRRNRQPRNFLPLQEQAPASRKPLRLSTAPASPRGSSTSPRILTTNPQLCSPTLPAAFTPMLRF